MQLKPTCTPLVGHAIREMMHDRNAPPLSGLVEIDLKYLGGAPKRRKEIRRTENYGFTVLPNPLAAGS